ncbi:GntR family transcriptional regulator [Falsarthrobacter nasiphocae]|uniref:DNA-binding GntR family transcriptional regulator n=1 Tax=Falsarthrobacter nasiphocae TaxID=189863 RepID=A0AAE4C6D8_9MICC|nr:GntR family transcriptional regulator [Falsarthrobacter nasiphocae]MDR6891384.1 DNA-binding GntR family transcriptional regulator [Falsarthrobacter nasiphocae]
MRASDLAYTELRRDIVEWRLEPGRVLGEVEQAERLGVSRTPLREALKQLQADGLVEPHGGRGVVVTHVSADHVDALFEARAALDTASAALAARRADPVRFERLTVDLEDAAIRLEADPDDESVETYYVLVTRLDDLVDEAADNPYLRRAHVPLKANLARLRRATRESPGRLRASATEHAAIARAIASGDPDLASAATRVHLEAARRAIVSALAHLDPPESSAPRSEATTRPTPSSVIPATV